MGSRITLDKAGRDKYQLMLQHNDIVCEVEIAQVEMFIEDLLRACHYLIIKDEDTTRINYDNPNPIPLHTVGFSFVEDGWRKDPNNEFSQRFIYYIVLEYGIRAIQGSGLFTIDLKRQVNISLPGATPGFNLKWSKYTVLDHAQWHQGVKEFTNQIISIADRLDIEDKLSEKTRKIINTTRKIIGAA